ncbi:MAG: hypothetical protein JWM88_538 [Verrucomicrobia bacterium]|nr:hypothetical protein [Verrucomicrobiota bacterium]
MNLTGHIVRKDLFRLRWLLVLWVLALVARLTFADLQAMAGESGLGIFRFAALTFGGWFLPALGIGLLMGLQSDDPVSGQEAFWITRPISGGRLLAAKSLTLALFLAVPVAVTLPWWLLHGYGAGQVAQAATATVAIQASLFLLAVPIVVISPNGSRFILNLAAVALFFGLAELAWWMMGNYSSAVGRIVGESRGGFTIALWVTVVITTTLIQYLTRRTWLSVAILAVALVAVRNGWSPNAVPAELAPVTVPAPVLHLPLKAGTRAARLGTALAVQDVQGNDPRGVLAVVVESTPDFSALYDRLLYGPQHGKEPREFYFAVNRRDGNVIQAEVAREDASLKVATLRYFVSTLVFSPAGTRRGSYPQDRPAWIKDAELVKVVSNDGDALRLALAATGLEPAVSP